MPQDITPEELEAAMTSAVDEDGNDVRLAEQVAKMSQEQRDASDENIRRWAERFRANRRRDRDASDDL